MTATADARIVNNGQARSNGEGGEKINDAMG
jgi:hypothetical protein